MSFDLAILNGDFVLNNGDFGIVQGTNKLVQDILKICQTTAGANIYQPWYGSFITQSLIGTAFDQDISLSIATNQLHNSIENLKKLQQLQLTSSQQTVTPDEQIAAINSINISQNNTDSRRYDVVVKVISRAFRPATVNFPISATT